jgi:hypothetical protein
VLSIVVGCGKLATDSSGDSSSTPADGGAAGEGPSTAGQGAEADAAGATSVVGAAGGAPGGGAGRASGGGGTESSSGGMDSAGKPAETAGDGPEASAGAGGARGSSDTCVPTVLQPTVDDCAGTLVGCTGETMAATQWWEADGASGFAQTVDDLSMQPSGAFAMTGITTAAMDFGSGIVPVGQKDAYTVYTASFGSDSIVQWARGIHSPYAQAGRVATDALGNTFVTGFFDKSIDFEDGNDPITSKFYDAFQVAYDAQGSMSWARILADVQAGDPKMQVGFAVAATGDGAAIFGGHFSGTVDFGGGHTRSVPNASAYIMKRTASGARAWDTAFEADTAYVDDLAIDGDCNVWAFVSFSGNLNLLSKTLPGDIGQLALLELDAHGTLIDGWSFGSDVADWPHGMALDSSGHVVLGGSTNGNLDFGPGALPAGAGTDGFIAYLNAGASAATWAARVAGPGTQEVMDVAFDPFGNVLVTGSFDGTPVIETTTEPDAQPFEPSLAKGVFALKLDPQGHVLWGKSYGDDAGQLSGAIATDAAANIYVAGALAGYLDTLHSTGAYDAFLLKLSP